MGWGTGGLRWPVVAQGGRLLTLADDGSVAQFDASAAETLAKVHTFVDQVVGGVMLRMIVRDQLDPPVVTDTYRPSADGPTVEWQDETGGSLNIYASIDEATLDDTDWVGPSSLGQVYELYIDSSGGTSTTSPPLISELRVYLVVQNDDTSADAGISVSIESLPGTPTKDTPLVANADGTMTVSVTFTEDGNGDDITEQQLEDLDGAAPIHLVPSNNSTYNFDVFQVWVEVDSQDGPLADATAAVQDDGWVAFADGWDTAAGATYYVTIVKTNSGGRCVWPLLDSGQDCPHASWVSRVPTMNGTLIASMTDPGTAVHPVVLERSDATASDDSQPYAALHREAVHSARTVEQEWTPPSGVSAGWVEFVAARHPEATADLTVTVRQRSDDAQVGQLAFPASDVGDSPRKLAVRADNLSASLTGGTQYYLEFTSTAEESAPWTVAVLSGETPPVSGESAGFAGATDAATVDGAEQADADAPFALIAAPAAVTGVTATAGTAQVTVDWTATAHGSNFDAYIVERGGMSIAEITDESVTQLTDTGALQGTAETWGVRVRLTDGSVSEPATDTATAAALAGDATHRISSLHDSSVDLDVAVTDDGIDYDFPADAAELALLGRDHVRMLRSPVDRGDRFGVDVLVDAGVDVAAGSRDRALFDSIVALRDAAVPHLVVTSVWGRRWYAAVRLDGGRLDGATVTHGRASLSVVEVASRPTVAVDP